MRFDPEYIAQVLDTNFEDAKARFLAPLLAIHHAHLVMLADQRIIGRDDARRVRDALASISVPGVEDTAYDGSFEDLFFFVDRLLIGACGEDTAGRLHTARSRNDIDMTMYRMRLRGDVLDVIAAVIELRACLLGLAERHRDTIFAAHTHTQPAQPTTIAHYLLGVVEQLERDIGRLTAAFASTNRSPLGACAITGTGFTIDRHLTSRLLGFDGPTVNTYGSIATVDYLLESVSSTCVLLVGLGRFVQDLLLWCTKEFGYLRLADGFVQSSSIMPQKRNPVALEHARAICSKALGQAMAVTMSVHNTPFGDIVDTEDDLQPLIAASFRDAVRTLTLVSAAMRAAEFDVARLREQAGVGGTTATELADDLVRHHGLPFSKAHGLVARLVLEQRARPTVPTAEIVAPLAHELLGTPWPYSEAELDIILSPRHFVEVRTMHGGPAASETARAIAVSLEALEADRTWLARTRRALLSADALRAERAQSL